MPKAREEGEHERGVVPPHVRGVLGPPPRKILKFERFYVRFLWGFHAFGTRF